MVLCFELYVLGFMFWVLWLLVLWLLSLGSKLLVWSLDFIVDDIKLSDGLPIGRPKTKKTDFCDSKNRKIAVGDSAKRSKKHRFGDETVIICLFFFFTTSKGDKACCAEC